MDKYEYRVRAEEIKVLISSGKYGEAVKIADTIDWRRVKSTTMLCTISDLYKVNRRFEESKEILLLAYERYPSSRAIVYSLCELSIKMGEFVQAVEYYKEFVRIAPRDTGRYILQYRLYEAQDVSLEERIAVLEEFKKHDYREKWAYELAYLYHRVGLTTECIEEVDEMFLWFGVGKFVMKALELKALHEPLSQEQQARYQAYKNGLDGSIDREAILKKDEDPIGKEITETKQPTKPFYNSPEERNAVEQAALNAGMPTQQEMQAYYSSPVDARNPSMTDMYPGYFDQTDQQNTNPGYYGQTDQQNTNPGYYSQPDFQNTNPGYYSQTDLQNTNPGYYSQPDLQNTNLGYYSQPDQQNTNPGYYDQQDLQNTNPTYKGLGGQYTEAMQTRDQMASYRRAPHVTEPASVNTGIKPEPSVPKTPPKPVGYDTVNLQKAIAESMEQIMAEEEKNKPVTATTEVFFEDATKEFVTPDTAAWTRTDAPLDQKEEPGVTIRPTRKVATSHYDDILKQDTDGQISMVVPEADTVEDQITGQISIDDIMNRIKQQQRQRQEEEVAKRVQDKISTVISQYDEDVKYDLQKEMEKEVKRELMGGNRPKPERNAGRALLSHAGNVVRPSTEPFVKAGAEGIRRANEEKIMDEDDVMDLDKLVDDMPDADSDDKAEDISVKEKDSDAADSSDEIKEKDSDDTESKDETEKSDAAEELNDSKEQESEDESEESRNSEDDSEVESKESVKSDDDSKADSEDSEVSENEDSENRSDESKDADSEKKVEESEAKDSDDHSDSEESKDQTEDTEDSAAYNNDIKEIVDFKESDDLNSEESKEVEDDEPEPEGDEVESEAEESEDSESESEAPVRPGRRRITVVEKDDSEALEVPEYTEEVVEMSLGESFDYETEDDTEDKAEEDTDKENTDKESSEETKDEKTKADESDIEDEASKDNEVEDADASEETSDTDIKDETPIEETSKEGTEETNTEETNTEETDTKESEPEQKPVDNAQETGFSEGEAETESEAKELDTRVRVMTPEEKDLFGPYIHHRKSRKQIIRAIDSLNMSPSTNNAIVTGEEGTGTINLAKGLIKSVQANGSGFSGKVAKITAQALNRKSVSSVIEKLDSGALIIQRAADMKSDTVESLYKELTADKHGIIIVMEDNHKDMDRLLKRHPELSGCFNVRVDVEALDNESLVAYAKQYALEREYKIDNFGMLSLHSRIEEMQTIDHDVTISEVRDIVDEAIRSAEKKTISHFFDVVLNKRYDEEDMIILTEKDFERVDHK